MAVLGMLFFGVLLFLMCVVVCAGLLALLSFVLPRPAGGDQQPADVDAEVDGVAAGQD